MSRCAVQVLVVALLALAASGCLRTLPDTGANPALLLLNSGSSGSGSSGSTTTDLTASIDPPSSSGLATSGSIVVSFSKEMDPSSLSLNGALAGDTSGGVWTSTNLPNDTLTLAPTTNWTIGNDRQLSVSIQDTDGQSYAQTLRYDVVNLVVYVSIAGNDGFAGTSPATALRTIAAGITLAAGSTPAVVQVAGYTDSSGYFPGGTITMSNDISLKGGFDEAFTIRDPFTYVTRVSIFGAAGGPVFSANGLAGNNEIEGFRINISGVAGSNVRGIETDDSNINIFANVIEVGGSGTGSDAFAIQIGNSNGKSAAILNNILITADAPAITMQAAVRLAGPGTGTGVTVIANNYMVGASASNSSRGVWIQTGATPDPVVITNNTMVLTGTTGDQRGVDINATAAGARVIRNNIIIADDECITETNPANDDPSVGSVTHNDLLCATAYVDEGATNYALSGTIDTSGTFETLDTGLDNIAVNPQFNSAATLDFSLTTSSPCAVTTGGIDLSGLYSYNFDISGSPRTSSGGALTTGWSIGADESDDSCI